MVGVVEIGRREGWVVRGGRGRIVRVGVGRRWDEGRFLATRFGSWFGFGSWSGHLTGGMGWVERVGRSRRVDELNRSVRVSSTGSSVGVHSTMTMAAGSLGRKIEHSRLLRLSPKLVQRRRLSISSSSSDDSRPLLLRPSPRRLRSRFQSPSSGRRRSRWSQFLVVDDLGRGGSRSVGFVVGSSLRTFPLTVEIREKSRRFSSSTTSLSTPCSSSLSDDGSIVDGFLGSVVVKDALRGGLVREEFGNLACDATKKKNEKSQRSIPSSFSWKREPVARKEENRERNSPNCFGYPANLFSNTSISSFVHSPATTLPSSSPSLYPFSL